MISTRARRIPQDPPETSPRQDALQLAALVRDCELAGIARQACVVRLSRLTRDRVQPQHFRLARAALEPLAHAERARLFVLPNQDLVAVWRGPAETALLTVRTAISHLFADVESEEGEALWEELSLPQDSTRLLRLAETPKPAARIAASGGLPLDLTSLALLEARLARVDVARFARRQPVCAMQKDGSFRLQWERRLLCVEELVETLLPGAAPRAEPWLYRRLTRSLDRRALALLAAPGELDNARPFGLELNVSSILAPEFLRFDAALPLSLRGQVILELQPADVLSDPAACLFARDFVRARGYRLLLQDVTAESLPMFPLPRIGLDFVHLRWSEPVARMSAAAFGTAPQTIVLADADGEDAIAWGRAQGIGLFQGAKAIETHRTGGRTR
jgi:hypothetical protein